VKYARRDLRSNNGILRSYSSGHMVPKWTINNKLYNHLPEKEKHKWVRIE